jgi:hypothetical protein
MVTFVPPAGDYAGELGWIVWGGANAQELKRQGWKLHVFVGDKAHAQRALNTVLPMLQADGINHKFWATDDPVLNPADTNQGKWFAIYPVSNVAAMEITKAVEHALSAAHVTPLGTDLAGEIKIDLGFVYARYAQYGPEEMVSPSDTTEADTRGVTAHPAWVENIWLHYTALTQPGSRIAVTLPADWNEEFPGGPFSMKSRRRG